MLVATLSPVLTLPQSQLGPRRQLDGFQPSVSTTPLPAPVPVPISLPSPLTAPLSLPMQVQVQVPAFAQRIGEIMVGPVYRSGETVSAYERLLAAQLAHLASQHHASDYNKLKFGFKGSPVAYVPLSLQASGHVRELRARQACYSEERVWWISERERCDVEEKRATRVEEVQALPAMVTSTSMDIQHEISAAMSSRMPSTHITKTSQSHPITISTLIPLDILSAIASRLVPSSISSPTMFHLPENCHLDRVTVVHAFPAHPFGPLEHPWIPPCLPSVLPSVPITWACQGSGELLQNALNVPVTFPPSLSFSVSSRERHGLRPPTDLPPSHPYAVQKPTPPSPPRGVVRRHRRHGRAMSAPPAFQALNGIHRRPPHLKEVRLGLRSHRSNPEVPTVRSEAGPITCLSPTIRAKSPEAVIDPQHDEPSINTADNGLMLPPASVVPSPAPARAPVPPFCDISSEDLPPVQCLGNMHLSSCPGKKGAIDWSGSQSTSKLRRDVLFHYKTIFIVRLSGPVKGRSAICRDLRADLSRIKELGVGCVICCLDDNELHYLGAPWSDYASVANELGLDVLRIPMPEGLTPLSPATLDTQLKQIIEAYTLRGIPVLAHCRGGVGRAGLVASCWMLKLGLCGWKDPEVCAISCSKHARCNEIPENVFWSDPNQTHEQGPDQRTQACSGQRYPQMDEQAQPQSSKMPATNVPRVCCATIQLVERALAVIRRRRSLKAVETYEQVRFLVDFVEYLDAETCRGGRGLLPLLSQAF